MDAVFDNIVGPAIGGAVGVGAWLVGETVKGVTNVVDAVSDLIQGTQPSPYEEWLNAPVPTQETTNEFRNPSNETTDTGLTAAEIISKAGIQETKTGTSSPNSGGEPENLIPLVPQQNNSDPQAPLTPDFVPPPQTVPPASLGANVLFDMWENAVINEPCEGCVALDFYPVYKGIKGTAFSDPYDRFVFKAEPTVDEFGERMWLPVAEATLSGKLVRRWTWDAAYEPPKVGLLKGVGYLAIFDETFDWFDPAGLSEGGWIRRYSLATPVAPPPIETLLVNPSIEQNDFPVLPDVFQPLPAFDVPDTFTPPIALDSTPYVPNPVIPPAVPTPPNNPTSFPPIGNDGKIILPPSQIPTTAPDVHVVDGVPFNSGAVRADLKGIATEVGRIEAKAAKLLDRTGGNGLDWAQMLFLLTQLADMFLSQVEGTTYTLNSVCEKDASGNPVSNSVSTEISGGGFNNAVLDRLDALVPLLQAQKDFKQPTCDSSSDPTILEGDFRTISFRSDETSPYGKSRLRKRFRYRGVSSNDLGTIVDHWKDFTWESGPYRVRWIGQSWRTPEVWAASEAEGQRVIQHAAREAGFSPLEGGRWSTRLSSSARLGVSDTMRVDTTGGYYWVTARDGSNERPIVAKT